MRSDLAKERAEFESYQKKVLVEMADGVDVNNKKQVRIEQLLHHCNDIETNRVVHQVQVMIGLTHCIVLFIYT